MHKLFFFSFRVRATWASSHQAMELLSFRSLDQVHQLVGDSFLEWVILNTHTHTHTMSAHIQYLRSQTSCPL